MKTKTKLRISIGFNIFLFLGFISMGLYASYQSTQAEMHRFAAETTMVQLLEQRELAEEAAREAEERKIEAEQNLKLAEQAINESKRVLED